MSVAGVVEVAWICAIQVRPVVDKEYQCSTPSSSLPTIVAGLSECY
jgi:hypothetical protein